MYIYICKARSVAEHPIAWPTVRTPGRTDERTDRPTDGRTDGRTEGAAPSQQSWTWPAEGFHYNDIFYITLMMRC